LALSNFTLDQFDLAMGHTTLDPRCGLLAEIHGCLLTIITAENMRVEGTAAATASGHIPKFVAPQPETEEAAITEEEKQVIVRQCLEYSRKWDRSKRLTTVDARMGWERHLIGCLIQRGGIETIPGLLRILKHLMTGYKKPKMDKPEHDGEKENGDKQNGDNPLESPLTPAPPSAVPASISGAGDDEDMESVDDKDDDGPPQQYLTLSLADKLAMLHFMTDLVINSRAVRAYIDACDNALTDLRKERIEVNRDRRNLSALFRGQRWQLIHFERRQAEKAALEGIDKIVGVIGVRSSVKADSPAPNSIRELSTPPTTVNGDADADELVASGSEIDELASEAGDASYISTDVADVKSGSRKTALQAKALQKKAQAAIKAKDIAKSKNMKNTPSKVDIPDAQRIAEGLVAVEERDRLVDREFRRHADVLRIRPLGKDRFFNRYWYFDGVGTMELISAEDGSTVYGTGRLFIQGPSKEDNAFACTLASDDGAAGLEARRIEEEDEEGVLAVDEWAYLDNDKDVRSFPGQSPSLTLILQVETLMSYLNPKGNREHNLKQKINELRVYMRDGFIKRKQDLGVLPKPEPAPLEDTPNRRGTRAQPVPDAAPQESYLTWTNEFARHVMEQNKR
jgi:bromodomain adjacent to zinc finger domain protein 1A